MYRHKLRKWLLFQSLTNSYPNYLFLLSCLFLEGMKNKQNSVSLRIIHRVHFSWLIFLCVHYAKELLYFFFLFFLQLFSSISSVCASSDIVHLHDWKKNCANNALFTKKDVRVTESLRFDINWFRIYLAGIPSGRSWELRVGVAILHLIEMKLSSFEEACVPRCNYFWAAFIVWWSLLDDAER